MTKLIAFGIKKNASKAVLEMYLVIGSSQVVLKTEKSVRKRTLQPEVDLEKSEEFIV